MPDDYSPHAPLGHDALQQIWDRLTRMEERFQNLREDVGALGNLGHQMSTLSSKIDTAVQLSSSTLTNIDRVAKQVHEHGNSLTEINFALRGMPPNVPGLVENVSTLKDFQTRYESERNLIRWAIGILLAGAATLGAWTSGLLHGVGK